MRVVFNGKFLSGATKTGVHRVALELIRAFDRMLVENDLGRDVEWVLMCPHNAEDPPLLERIKIERRGRSTWQLWEQLELPWMARGDLLVNLCNLAPMFKHRSVTMIHDAQTFSSPASYPKSFAAFYQFALPMIGRFAVRILTVSEFARQDLAKYGIAKPSKTTVIHNGVDHVPVGAPDTRVIDRLGLDGAPFVIAFASLQAHKNIGLLFETFARPEMAGVKLVFVGGRNPEVYAEQGYTVPSNTVFAGRVDDGELAALYGSAVCLAFPSTTEGFGLPPLEAMLMNCPAVVAPCGALPEVCGDNALYAPPHDPAAWAQAILQLAGEGPAARSKRVERALAHARGFTWMRSAQQLFEVLRDVRAQLTKGRRASQEAPEALRTGQFERLESAH